jgi:hypothetical protein
MATLTLTAAGLDPLTLDAAHGFRSTSVDLGWPLTRAVSDDSTDRDGTDDTTAHHGARVVTIKAVIAPVSGHKLNVADQLARFCHPKMRPRLIIDAAGRVRHVDLRTDQWSSPLTGSALGELQVSWVAPSGLIHTHDPAAATLTPYSGPAAGRTYPLIYPRTYPAAAGASATLATNDGSASADWTIRVYGPCTDPVIASPDGDLIATHDGLTITAGHYVAFDSATRRVLEDDETGASRREFLDFTATTWAPLAPGTTPLTFTAATSSAPCNAVIEWHDAWLI